MFTHLQLNGFTFVQLYMSGTPSEWGKNRLQRQHWRRQRQRRSRLMRMGPHYRSHSLFIYLVIIQATSYLRLPGLLGYVGNTWKPPRCWVAEYKWPYLVRYSAHRKYRNLAFSSLPTFYCSFVFMSFKAAFWYHVIFVQYDRYHK